MFYFPFDLGFVVRRTLDLVRPKLFIMMETEIWPNLLRECRARGIKTAVVNGRLSARSFPRYRMVRPMMRRVLDHIDRFLVQSEESARRFIDLGADPGARRRHRQPEVRFARAVVDRAAGARARSRAALFPRAGVAPGDRRRQHDEGRRSRRCCARSARCARPRRTRCWCWRRETPSGSREAEQLARAEGWKVARRSDLAVDAEPRVDVVIARHHRRARDDLSDRDDRVRRRQPGRHRRSQRARAGGVRQADRVRPAHAELPRDRRRVCQQRRRRAADRRATSSKRRSCR